MCARENHFEASPCLGYENRLVSVPVWQARHKRETGLDLGWRYYDPNCKEIQIQRRNCPTLGEGNEPASWHKDVSQAVGDSSGPHAWGPLVKKVVLMV